MIMRWKVDDAENRLLSSCMELGDLLLKSQRLGEDQRHHIVEVLRVLRLLPCYEPRFRGGFGCHVLCEDDEQCCEYMRPGLAKYWFVDIDDQVLEISTGLVPVRDREVSEQHDAQLCFWLELGSVGQWEGMPLEQWLRELGRLGAVLPERECLEISSSLADVIACSGGNCRKSA
ncbi:MAG: hypothetical protein JW781_03745 [Deltaproteobacteria bacterium]|nr:hypothetical protein [Candidatus Anaeroferrophillacea bacterium]